MIKEFTVEGRDFVAEIVPDEMMGPPWKEHDGHGPVTDWVRRAKRPGEMMLSRDRESFRYYDFADAVKIAKRDGWGPGTPAEAALADFRYLRDWCTDKWRWVGVIVKPADACGNCAPSASLWGLDDTNDEYLNEIARELASEILASEVKTPLATVHALIADLVGAWGSGDLAGAVNALREWSATGGVK